MGIIAPSKGSSSNQHPDLNVQESLNADEARYKDEMESEQESFRDSINDLQVVSDASFTARVCCAGVLGRSFSE